MDESIGKRTAPEKGNCHNSDVGNQDKRRNKVPVGSIHLGYVTLVETGKP